MGLGDNLKNIAKQAQDAVAEHREQIHEAVDVVGATANRKTHGKHSAKIAKMSQKAGEAVDKLGGDGGRPPAGSDQR